jgi:carbamoyltransferase
MNPIWGINALSHDASLAVLKENDIVFASSAERFSKIKNDKELNDKLIKYAIDKFGYPNKIIVCENKFLVNLRRLFYGQKLQRSLTSYIRSFGISSPIESVNHHESHAAAGYFTSTFSDAAILIIDGVGEWDTVTLWNAKGNKLKKVLSYRYPNSIGLFYSAMTHKIGLKPNEEEYILMALASFGDPLRLKSRMIKDFFKSYPNKLSQNLHRGCLWWGNDLKESDYSDIAAATQSIYEDFFRSVLKKCSEYINSSNIVIGGGCALNCTANKIAYEYFKNVHIFFNPGDSGNAVGATLAHSKKHIRLNPFLGYEIIGTLNPKRIISELEENSICGVAVGCAEFGPRALGNRSLLGNPQDGNIINKLNKIKQRQEYRPFAISILKEYANDYFEMFNDKSSHMQYTYKGKSNVPSYLLHKDGTSRIQTVDIVDPLYELLKEWYHKTGIPYIINTSLNIKGQPIINDESDIVAFEKKYGVRVF